MSTMHALLIILFFFTACNDVQNCSAKKVSGKVKLSGVNTEHVLTKFAVSAYAKGNVEVRLISPTMYENEKRLRWHLYEDTDWPKWKRETLCTDKVRLAKRAFAVSFEYGRVKDNGRSSSKSTSGGPSKRDDNNEKRWRATSIAVLNQEMETRPHYLYIVLDDCSLEQYLHDAEIPEISYEVIIQDDVGGLKNIGQLPKLSHFSADEHMAPIMVIIMCMTSFLLTISMMVRIGTLIATKGVVHAALFMVMAACGATTLGCICEMIHQYYYGMNGYGWYLFDALSSHFEAVTDSIVSLLLLSIAAGWTLPSDAVAFQMGASKLQNVAQGLRNPAGALMSGSPAGMLALGIVAAHVGLAQWGRTYDDDFDSYHAFEHLPGRILMIFRIVLGLLLLVSSASTASTCNNLSLKGFYKKLALVGSIWFQSMPLVTWIVGWAFPYYLRHPAVTIGSSLAQLCSMVALSWLVTAHSDSSSYHKLSRLGSAADKDLTDKLGGIGGDTTGSTGGAQMKTWTFGKTKIRLD